MKVFRNLVRPGETITLLHPPGHPEAQTREAQHSLSMRITQGAFQNINTGLHPRPIKLQSGEGAQALVLFDLQECLTRSLG